MCHFGCKFFLLKTEREGQYKRQVRTVNDRLISKRGRRWLLLGRVLTRDCSTFDLEKETRNLLNRYYCWPYTSLFRVKDQPNSRYILTVIIFRVCRERSYVLILLKSSHEWQVFTFSIPNTLATHLFRLFFIISIFSLQSTEGDVFISPLRGVGFTNKYLSLCAVV